MLEKKLSSGEISQIRLQKLNQIILPFGIIKEKRVRRNIFLKLQSMKKQI